MSKKVVMSLDERWDWVRRHLEGSYKDPITKAYVKIKKRPDEKVIEYLFTQIKKLHDTEWELKRSKDDQ